MRNETSGLIMVHRKITELGLNRHGQHIKTNSTTLHKVNEVTEEDWGLLANYNDTIKLTPRGKSVQVSKFYINF